MHESFDPLLSLVLLVGVFVVHELGHYYVGAIAGIPADARRFVVLAMPPHVALADRDGWVSPFENERFSDAYGRFDPERRYARLFTAGGLLAQTFVAVSIGLAVGGIAPWFAVAVVRASLGFLGGLLVLDVTATAWRGRPFSDVTHLWRLDRRAAVGVLVLVFGAHVAALRWLA